MLTSPPLVRVVFAAKQIDPDIQAETINDSISFLSPTSVSEEVEIETVMESTDYAEVELRTSTDQDENGAGGIDTGTEEGAEDGNGHSEQDQNISRGGGNGAVHCPQISCGLSLGPSEQKKEENAMQGSEGKPLGELAELLEDR